MDEIAPWVRLDDRVTMLTPAVGVFALSPRGRYLAWVQTPPGTVVHVTELDALQTVCTLERVGDRVEVFALAWQGEELLRVFDVADRRVTVTRHAVPDGGVLGVVAMPRDGMKLAVHSSRDGRVSVVIPSEGVGRRPADALWVVGARGDDAVTRVPLDRFPQGRPVWPSMGSDGVLSPDGHRLVVVVPQAPRGSTACFTDMEGTCLHEVPCPPTDVSALGWLSATEVLLQGLLRDGRTELVRVSVDGARSPLATLPSPEGFEWIGLPPERDRVLLRGNHPVGDGYVRTVAVHLALATGALALLTLSHHRTRPYAPRDGGACWTSEGHLLTLTQSPPGVAHLTRRVVPGTAGRRLATFRLPGVHPRHLTLTPSPDGTRFVACWSAFDRGPLDPVRRLALLDA